LSYSPESDSYIYKFYRQANATYRRSQCVEVCKIEEISKLCGCLFLDLEFSLYRNLRACDRVDDIKCTENARINNYTAIRDRCDSLCPLECNSDQYKASQSFVDFPSNIWYNTIKNGQIFELKGRVSNYLDTFEKCKANMLKLKIFYQDLNYVQVTASKKILISDLLANIGGSIGLFLGVSILSFIEILEIVFEICINKLKNRNLP
jgi:acid-sensing ion channel 5